jgi:hypothetical protein
MKKSLLTLTLGGIVIGMTEFMMMGVLPDVARSDGDDAAVHLIQYIICFCSQLSFVDGGQAVCGITAWGFFWDGGRGGQPPSSNGSFAQSLNVFGKVEIWLIIGVCAIGTFA